MWPVNRARAGTAPNPRCRTRTASNMHTSISRTSEARRVRPRGTRRTGRKLSHRVRTGIQSPLKPDKAYHPCRASVVQSSALKALATESVGPGHRARRAAAFLASSGSVRSLPPFPRPQPMLTRAGARKAGARGAGETPRARYDEDALVAAAPGAECGRDIIASDEAAAAQGQASEADAGESRLAGSGCSPAACLGEDNRAPVPQGASANSGLWHLVGRGQRRLTSDPVVQHLARRPGAHLSAS